MRQRREKETREKESGWERPSVAMETGSYQLTPCFPLVPHPPPTPFPSQPVHLSITSPPHLFLPLFSFSHSLCHDHTPFTFLSHTPASPSSITRSLHQPHPCFFPPHPLIPRWLHFRPLTRVFLCSPPFSPVQKRGKERREPPVSPLLSPLFLFSR